MEDKKMDLIWVEKEFADKYKKIESDVERIKIFEDYIQTISEESKADYRANLAFLEEDVAIYTELMLKVKRAFEKAKNESLSASYELWESYEKEILSVREKIDGINKVLSPLETQLKTITDRFKNLPIYQLENFIALVERLSNATGKNKEMLEFLVKNFEGTTV